MFRMFKMVLVVLIAVSLFACQSDKDDADNAAENAAEVAEPDFISVQHILIGFQGSVPGKNITRTKEEASELANKVFNRARAGEDFDKLVAITVRSAISVPNEAIEICSAPANTISL